VQFDLARDAAREMGITDLILSLHAVATCTGATRYAQRHEGYRGTHA